LVVDRPRGKLKTRVGRWSSPDDWVM